jgi:stearoyl-CoA desaturase (delta-9 desaturase)
MKQPDDHQEAGATADQRRGLFKGIRSWFDNEAASQVDESRLHEVKAGKTKQVHWTRVAPFVFLHGGCLAVIWTGWSPVAAAVALALLVARTFFLTGFYHRYFSHKSFETSRAAQFIFALLTNTAVQRGPLWWAATHRHHHAASDTPDDPHSPTQHGIFWSHIGWLFDPANHRTRWNLIPDLARFPELRWLDRFDTAVVGLLFAGLYGLGAALAAWAPGLGTSGWQMVVWGFFISTVVLFHTTNMVNSAAHLFGRKRFPSSDTRRNSALIALVTMGEGWHNNHHYYQAAVRQGFYWWQIDATFYVLWCMQRLGIIWNLNAVPEKVLALGRENMGRQKRRRRARAA